MYIQILEHIWTNQNILKTECWHQFLTRVKEDDDEKERLPIWKKPKHAQDQGRPMESWPMGQKNILGRCWSVRFGNRPMEVADKSEGKKKSELYENSDDLVIDF